MTDWEMRGMPEYRSIRALIDGMWKSGYGKWGGYELVVCGKKLPSEVDQLGRKSALFCYGLEELQFDHWVPVDYASYDLERVRLVRKLLEEKLGHKEFRIVRFQKNVEVKE